MAGLFITVEGPDGAGKTSVIERLLPKLQEMTTKEIISTREPGGSRIAEQIRQIILDVDNTEMDSRTEAILYAASRRQHLTDKVFPNLEKGNIIICDRFVDSSLVYQGIARGIGIEEVRHLNQFAIEGLHQAITLYIDIPSDIGLSRIRKERKEAQFDRLDQESLNFHQMVRQGYLQLIEAEPERFIQIDGRKDLDQVVEECFLALTQMFPDVFIK